MIIVSFTDIAPVPPCPFHKDELIEILRGCELLIETNDKESLEDEVESWELALLYTCRDCDDDWYTHALICVCLRGLFGDTLPKFMIIEPRNNK